MTSKQRAYLKSLAAPLESTLQIGKSGLTPEVTEAVREAFNTRELLKINVLKSCMDDIKTTADILSERTASQVVQVIGKKIVLYKESRDNKKIELP
ncbi:MAG: ribosome assembly RNA-binding protein YhbY [Lachnospiraceae bacterium]|nr:ribosome assembly RNA-binding protein YhbY [Lachnospiraceae bacterium]MDE6965208.1 ribosome assembly RNA-binding protein YhbY [Lachnospiraceae bacterium]